MEASMLSLHLNEETVSVDDFSDIQNATIDREDPTWYLDEDEDQGVTEELCRDTDSDDSDYNPQICVRAGGAMKSQNTLDDIPEMSIEDTVHDMADLDDDAAADLPPFPDQIKVVCEDDILCVPASIAYHSSLQQLVQYLQIPVDTCKTLEQRTGPYCGASKPFEVAIRSRGTAAIIEWTCPRGH